MYEFSKEKIWSYVDILPKHIQQHVPKSYFCNKVDGSEKMDKVLDFIYALFAITKSKKFWEPRHWFFKFMGILPNKRNKKDDVFFISYKPP